jgi:hypothetical protein
MEYLVFKGLMIAVCVAVFVWKIKGIGKVEKPKELEDGNFAIPKPEDEFMKDVEYDEIVVNPNFKNESQRPPDPKGVPTTRPV